MSSSKFCPSLGVYAAIRMDPTGMVAHLDTRAVEEAQGLCPKTYLVFIEFGLSLPFPGRPWYDYLVLPIGTSLRAVNETRGFDEDMCAPIFPNVTHPTGRPSVRPDGMFPYDNCYHWAGMDLDIRVRGREEGFDHTYAIELSVKEQMDMASLFRPDLGRATRTRLAREQTATDHLEHASAPDSSPLPPLPAAEHSDNVATSSEIDIFEPPEDFEDPKYTPLVHLWLDLPANLKQEDIGNPVDLYRERFAVASIIRGAHERNSDLPTLREHIALTRNPSVNGSDSDSMSYMSRTDSAYCWSETDPSKAEDDHVGKEKRFRPGKLLRKLREGVRKALCIPIY